MWFWREPNQEKMPLIAYTYNKGPDQSSHSPTNGIAQQTHNVVTTWLQRVLQRHDVVTTLLQRRLFAGIIEYINEHRSPRSEVVQNTQVKISFYWANMSWSNFFLILCFMVAVTFVLQFN